MPRGSEMPSNVKQALCYRLYDLIFDHDDGHGTGTLCYVWPQSERRYIVAA